MHCDFCYEQVGLFTWTYLTEPFFVPAERGYSGFEEGGKGWASCDTCSELVEAGKLEELIIRGFVLDGVVNLVGSDVPSDVAMWWKRRLFTAFFEHRKPGRSRGLPVWVAETQHWHETAV